jgi:hypothetical protein
MLLQQLQRSGFDPFVSDLNRSEPIATTFLLQQAGVIALADMAMLKMHGFL